MTMVFHTWAYGPQSNLEEKINPSILKDDFSSRTDPSIFNSKFYNQIDGVAMGFPSAPVLANIFMGFHESKRLNEYSLNKPKFYLRCVDDILAAFDNDQDSLIF